MDERMWKIILEYILWIFAGRKDKHEKARDKKVSRTG